MLLSPQPVQTVQTVDRATISSTSGRWQLAVGSWKSLAVLQRNVLVDEHPGALSTSMTEHASLPLVPYMCDSERMPLSFHASRLRSCPDASAQGIHVDIAPSQVGSWRARDRLNSPSHVCRFKHQHQHQHQLHHTSRPLAATIAGRENCSRRQSVRRPFPASHAGTICGKAVGSSARLAAPSASPCSPYPRRQPAM